MAANENTNPKVRAERVHQIVQSRTRNQVKLLVELGNALGEIYEHDLWDYLGFRSWSDYCHRAADMSTPKADKLIEIAYTFTDYKIPESVYVGITKIMIILPVCVSEPATRKWLKLAQDYRCDDLKQKVRKEIRKRRKKGYPTRIPTNRTNTVAFVLEPHEELELRTIIELFKEKEGACTNGEAVLDFARAWAKQKRLLKAV